MAVEVAVLTVREVAAGVLGEPVRLVSELVAAERAVLDATEERPVTEGLTGERTPVADLTGEAVRADMLAEVGGLEADAEAEETELPTLVLLVLRTADGGAEGARLARDTAARAGVAATLLRGLRRAAATAEDVAVVAERVDRTAGVGAERGSSSTLCISSSGDST